MAMTGNITATSANAKTSKYCSGMSSNYHAPPGYDYHDVIIMPDETKPNMLLWHR
jgi:hypothetical protein